MNKKRIIKTVIRPDEIESSRYLPLSDCQHSCPNCGSLLFYIKVRKGVVAEDFEYMVMGNRSKRTYEVREIGLDIFCAECGEFWEVYHTFMYDKDKVIYELEEYDEDDYLEIEYCLREYNQKGTFTTRFTSYPVFKTIKEKLDEYEKKHPLPKEKS